VRRYEAGIFVREQGPGGKWGNAALRDLSPERWAYHVARWLEEGILPVRIRESDEIERAVQDNLDRAYEAASKERDFGA
jgi:hypothetical protein